MNTNGAEEVLQNQHRKKSFILCACFFNQNSTESTEIAAKCELKSTKIGEKCESNQAIHV